MNNIVTMELSKYDDMRWEIDYLNEKIKRMEEDRARELKDIFKIVERKNEIDITINYGNTIKKLYGEDIKIDGRVYRIDDDKDLTEIGYNIWKLVKEED